MPWPFFRPGMIKTLGLEPFQRFQGVQEMVYNAIL